MYQTCCKTVIIILTFHSFEDKVTITIEYFFEGTNRAGPKCIKSRSYAHLGFSYHLPTAGEELSCSDKPEIYSPYPEMKKNQKQLPFILF